MADERTQPHVHRTQPHVHRTRNDHEITRAVEEIRGLPGCGLALYAAILAVGFTVGLSGMLGSTWALLNPGTRGPSELTDGRSVAVWRLEPLRATRLVELTEVPLGYHDESARLNGSTACALMANRLIRVEGEQGKQIAYTDIRAVDTAPHEGKGLAVTSTGEAAAVTCYFLEGEGGPRFARQLRHEAGLEPIEPIEP